MVDSFEPRIFSWEEKAATTGVKDYTELSLKAVLFLNTDYKIYNDWLSSNEARTYISSDTDKNLSYQDLNYFVEKFKNYDAFSIEIFVQFPPINAKGMQGGFCMYKADTQKTLDSTEDSGAAGNDNVRYEALGISCSVVKSTSGPTVSGDDDFRTYWLPTTYKEQLDAKTLNLWDDADTVL